MIEPFILITLAMPAAKAGAYNLSPKWRVCVGPSRKACKLDARSAEGRAAGLLVKYVNGARLQALAVGDQLAHEWRRMHGG